MSDFLTDDVDSILSDFFGENITYTPKGGTVKTIRAYVQRDKLHRLAEAQQGLVNTFPIVVSRSDVPSINLEGDTFTFAPRIGGATKVYMAKEIVDQDSAQFHLMVG